VAENKLLDASVIIGTFVEGNKPAHMIVTGKGKNHIPRFALIEVANGVRYANKSEFVFEAILKFLKDKKFIEIDFEENDLIKASEIALALNTTVYDALYHAMAIRLNHTFYTLDAKYYARTKQLGNIVLLGQ